MSLVTHYNSNKEWLNLFFKSTELVCEYIELDTLNEAIEYCKNDKNNKQQFVKLIENYKNDKYSDLTQNR